MPKYRAKIVFPSGEFWESDNIYDNYDDAYSDGEYLVEEYYECAPAGYETLHLSDPDEYPDENVELDEPEVEVEEV